MIAGMYSAARGMLVAERAHYHASENLANANTPGYRTRRSVQATFSVDEPLTLRSETINDRPSFSIFHQGPLERTGRPLDVALAGDAFFTVAGPNGPIYTKNGAFQLNTQRQLVSAEGRVVQGQGGPITFPEIVGQITINSDGAVYSDRTEIGRLQLATFPDNAALLVAGTTTFQGAAPQTPEPGAVRVEQGFRESSNANPVTEMILMMQGLRIYEAAEKTVRAISDALSLSTRPQG